MKTQLAVEVHNEAFLTAWKYVVGNYAYLFLPELQSVSYLLPAHHLPGADGLHIWTGVSHITVRHNPRHTPSKFVEILVHELTHLAQHSSGRAQKMTAAQLEAEAYPAGFTAKGLYEYQEIQDSLKAMRRRA